jgi:hypothetical protein
MTIDFQNSTDESRRRSPGASPQSTPSYYNSPDCCALRAAIMKALQDFPEARDSVIRALRDLHAQDPNAPNS